MSEIIPDSVAVVGSREYPDLAEVRAYVNALPYGTLVISGGAPGVDTAAENAAVERYQRGEWDRPLIIPADWNGPHGRRAGIVRNGEIVARAARVVAYYCPQSKGGSVGTLNAIDRAKKTARPTIVVTHDHGVRSVATYNAYRSGDERFFLTPDHTPTLPDLFSQAALENPQATGREMAKRVLALTPIIGVDDLARLIHEAAIEAACVATPDLPPVRAFDAQPAHIQDGRRVQARYLLARLIILSYPKGES